MVKRVREGVKDTYKGQMTPHGVCCGCPEWAIKCPVCLCLCMCLLFLCLCLFLVVVVVVVSG